MRSPDSQGSGPRRLAGQGMASVDAQLTGIGIRPPDCWFNSAFPWFARHCCIERRKCSGFADEASVEITIGEYS